MLKKFAIGATAVATFGLCADALADSMDSSGSDGTGFYVRGEGSYGWADSKANKVIGFPAGIVAPLGIQPTLRTNNKKSRGFTGRIGASYSINQYFGIETSFSVYHPAYRSLTFKGNLPLPQGTGTGAVKTSLYAFDLMGKATIPFNNFYAFVEGGGAYVHAKNSALTANFGNNPITFLKASSKGFVRPKVGAGIGYNLISNLAVDVSYSRIFGKGSISSPNYLSNLNTTMVGLTYKF
ncbi:outer membrane protein [Coxiella-like endosymbiont]|uniref:outer membrane protein n=1 Tax=Coxiella-like endosymbiont TaxID=1592897 RepID=UPI002729DDB3|nr:outer membrane beta-barrel protein [Coxiella-like endosymbiont]